MNDPILEAALVILKTCDMEVLLNFSDSIDDVLSERCFSEGEDEYSYDVEEENEKSSVN